MLAFNYTQELLGLQDVEVEKVENFKIKTEKAPLKRKDAIKQKINIKKIKQGAVSNANFRAFEAALFLCIEAKIQKIKKKASK